MQASEPSSAIVQYSLNPAPTLAPVDPLWQLVFTSISGIAALAAIIYLIREAIVHRTLLPVMMIAGTTAALWFEPIFDMMAFLIYPHEGAWVALESFGRKVPWVDTLAYYFYFPLPMWYFMKKFDARAAAAFFWKSYAIIVASSMFIEIPYMATGMWKYYGGQPLVFMGYPALLAFWSSPSMFGGAFVFHKIRHRLNGWKVMLAIPLMPMIILGFSCQVLYPYTTALHMPPNDMRYLAGAIGTALFSVLTMWFLFPRFEQK